MMLRRSLLGLASGVVLLGGCATAPPVAQVPPIVFVHGNGDTAALWQTTLWRFESNGWPRTHLHAIDMPYPLARDDDSKAQPGRSSAAENMAHLKAEVDKVRQATGADKVVLMGNSRGGNAIRNYIQNGGGAAMVSHAILGGTPNHGVWSIPGFREANEFAGTGPFLKGLNAPKNAAGDEVARPVKWMTIRSDNNDKFAQPDGLWIGMAGKPTGVTFAGPELKGATNVVIPRIDHRETSFSPAAFDAAYRFITGQTPRAAAIVSEARPVLSGKVTGLGVNPADPQTGNFPNNLPLASASVEVFAVDPATGVRNGPAVHRQTVGVDGVWGPFNASPATPYEFVVSAPGYAIAHIYRSPFARSSQLVHIRAERLTDADKSAGAVVVLTRPRGYFDPGRDAMQLDGTATLPGVTPGAGVASSRLRLPATERSVTAEFNGERLAGRAWPAAQGHVSVLELTY